MTFSRVLLTGADGFIGAHVLDNLLRKGFNVRGVVRSNLRARADIMLRARPQYRKQLDFHFIDDLATPGVFNEAIKGIDGVIHCAGPVLIHPEDGVKQVITPVLNGSRSVLEASATSGTVKRVVYTSSMGAVIDMKHNPTTPYTFTPADWNDITEAEATDPNAGPGEAYRGSKALAEKAAWGFMKEQKPAFDLVTLCPSTVFGPVAGPIDTPSQLSESNTILWMTAATGEYPFIPTDVWIDVRDLAELHVQSLTNPAAGGKRYLPASPEKFTCEMVGNIIREEFPDWPAERIAKGAQQIHDTVQVDAEHVKRDFPDMKYTKFRDMVVAFFKQVSKLEKS